MKRVLLFVLFLLCSSSVVNAAGYSEIKPTQFVDTVKSGDDVRLVFLFTSWCSICKSSFNDLIALSDRYKDKKVSIIAVSLDENEEALKKYLSSLDIKNFEVRRMKYDYLSELQAAFARAGIGYKGAIPHITLYSKDGGIVADGNYSLASFDYGLDILLKGK